MHTRCGSRLAQLIETSSTLSWGRSCLMDIPQTLGATHIHDDWSRPQNFHSMALPPTTKRTFG